MTTARHASSRSTRFAIERPLLTRLPDVPPVLAVWTEVKVHTDGHVVYKKALYSVPFTLVGKQSVAEGHRHRRADVPPARARRDPPAAAQARRSPHGADHQPPEAQAWLEHDPQWCLARAKEIGPACHAVILALFNDKVLVNLRGAQGIVRMREKVRRCTPERRLRTRAHVRQPEVPHRQDHSRQGAGQPACERHRHKRAAPADTYLNGGRFGRDLQSILLH